MLREGCSRLGVSPIGHLEALTADPQRLLALRLALTRAVRAGSHVLDAGCGALGILALMAAQLGAGRVVGVDRAPLQAARALAKANGLTVEFVESDLAHVTLAGGGGGFDVLVAMIYNNDPMADMPQQGLTFDLLKRFGHADTVSIPSHVTYNATAYEWPALDFNERLAEYESYLGAVEGYCGLRLPLLAEHPDAIVPSSLRNPAFALSRLPGRDHLGRLDKTGARLLSQPIPFAEIRYTNERTLFYPERFLIPLVSDGIMTAVVWRQDLWYQDLLLRTNESFSFIRNPRRVSGQATVLTNAIWQATNLLQLSES